jgi:hypothetical protein
VLLRDHAMLLEDEAECQAQTEQLERGAGLLFDGVSECGRLRQGADDHLGGERRRSVLMLPTP